ncbi:putative small nucleolar ribonucleoprotein complex subunit utp14 [Phaeomoniella chlamydospora]|uniref:Putative small nucleolar ribonucleoprotein complex subunit utp14 n=1 Tax=Phaeomoniella chlamydospora TaxID=158046 RepID=A0A0G2F3P8_PHACM|nr:putative small nucleolar ribonucleoprotein complex subunit utp14 [Phaeomoniella chlamydospora]
MARQAFSSAPSSKRSRSSSHKFARTAKRANLDALALAEASTTEGAKVKQSRLGHINDEGSDDRASKRRKVEESSHEDDDDLSGEEGSDGEGNAWHYGFNEGDEDSDIDSDEALGESDEERFEGFAFRGSKSNQTKNGVKKVQKPSRKLNLSEGESEDDDEEEDDLGEEAVDLATALDMNIATEKEEEAAQRTHLRKESQSSDIGSGNQSDGSGSDEEEDSRSSVFSLSENEDVPGGHKRLLDFVEDLNEKNSKQSGQNRQQSSSYMLQDPSEFGIQPTKKLTAADLLQTVTDPRLRQSLKMLHNADKEETKINSKGIPGKLAAPLAKRQQDRLDRAAAYEKSKETLSRWIDTVKQNRRAEHIQFPLPDPDAQAALGSKQLLPTSVSTPITSLESTIHNIMVESGLTDGEKSTGDQKLAAFEELQEKSLPIEEVKARRAELRKARELMFCEEIRAKRINKIKSKAYRRVHRKERDKAAQEERAALAAAGVLDSEEEREKADRRRAEERMGARHRESKWAKGMKATGRGVWDDDARAAATDMARRDEELRRRIEGKSAKASDSGDDFSEADSDDDVSSLASDEADSRSLERGLRQLQEDQGASPGFRLNSLKFMQKADAARKAVNDAEIRQMQRDLRAEASSSGSEDDVPLGRRSYRNEQVNATNKKSSILAHNEFEEPMSDDENGVTGNVPESNSLTATKPGKAASATPKLQKPNSKRQELQARLTVADSDDDGVANNPWLSGKSANKKKSSSGDVVVSASAILGGDKSSMGPCNGSQVTSNKNKVAKSTGNEVVLATGSDDDDTTNDANDQTARNEELVRLAFAGDDVFDDFVKEKEETTREEGDQIIDNSLPGWGSWAGEGISKKAQKAQKRNQAKFNTVIKGVQGDKRRDAKLDRVIINEKKVKKNNKYLASELPHPFESRQQYERSLRLPLGPEWSTKNSFQDATKPRVLMKQGIIRPMDRPSV